MDEPICYTVLEFPSGRTEWRLGELLHRIGGPAVIWNRNGTEEYYEYGVRHRIGGPAVINHIHGSWTFYVNGEVHRENGPARKDAYGNESYFLNNTQYSKSDYFNEMIKRTNKSKEPDDFEICEFTIEQVCILLGKKIKIIE